MYSSRSTSWWAATSIATVAVLLAVGAFGFAVNNQGLPIEETIRDTPKWFGVQNGFSALVFVVPGWYLAVKAPRVIFGWLLLTGAAGHGIAGAAWGYLVSVGVGGGGLPGAEWMLPLSGPGVAVEVPILAAIVLLYPDGKLPSSRIWLLGLIPVVLGTIGVLASAVDPYSDFAVDPESSLAQLSNPIGIDFFHRFDGGGVLWMAPAGFGGTVVLFARWIAARGETRRVLGWLVAGSLMGLVFSPLLLLGGEWFLLTVQLPTVLALVAVVAATLRHRVFGIEVVVGRAFLYTTMLGLVALLYGAIVGLSTLLAGDAGAGASFLAAAVAAFALAPARGRLERVINHLLFGKRDEPYAVLSSVASRLEAAGAPEELLPEFTAHVQAALNVPYIAVEYGKGGDRRLISHGRESQQAERFPLTNHGAEIGALLVGPRNGERGFSQTEHDLLTNLARQASAAVANVVLTEDLKRSRERIVSAREEERRRLRRDLHDGLGPVLTGAAMMIDAGRNLIPTDPTTANEQFIEARAQVKGAIDDVRRLVYALRPPALDELGLVGALKEQFERGPVAVTIRTEGLLVELPAAVEVAAFRIISEAITNAARHSSATTCAIAINLNGALEIDIHDNGTSVTPWRPGVGMSSMRERAAELGGLCEIGPDSDGRGRVHAVLPVAVAS